MNKKYVKVMFGNVSGANKDIVYRLDEVNVAKDWKPNLKNPEKMGGFNFSTEDKILRWLCREDTLYDVYIPKDAQVVEYENKSALHGVFRTNKIIISNPKTITDDLATILYLKSDLPEQSYYKALAGLAIRGHINTCKKLIKDRVNENNVNIVLEEISDFIGTKIKVPTGNDIFDEIIKILYNIKKENEC